MAARGASIRRGAARPRGVSPGSRATCAGRWRREGGGMRVIALQYHDVIAGPDLDASGAPGRDAATYKLTREAFERHVAAVTAAATPGTPSWREALPTTATGEGARHVVLFTFDDGGVGAHDAAAELLERHGWRGFFFVTTDWIGRRGFLDEQQLRDLDARGHVIGAHSRSHPVRFAYCSRAEMHAEWDDSVRRLADVLGHEVTTASVPGGYF